jgi:hypothetical protein
VTSDQDARINKEEMAKAVARVLSESSCPEILTAEHMGAYDDPNAVGIEATDGSLFFLEVKDI